MVFKSPICAWLRHYHANSQLKNHSLSQRYRGADFIYKGIAVTGSSMLYSRILSNCSIGSVRNSKAF
jgi:hypothetical protein